MYLTTVEPDVSTVANVTNVHETTNTTPAVYSPIWPKLLFLSVLLLIYTNLRLLCAALSRCGNRTRTGNSIQLADERLQRDLVRGRRSTASPPQPPPVPVSPLHNPRRPSSVHPTEVSILRGNTCCVLYRAGDENTRPAIFFQRQSYGMDDTPLSWNTIPGMDAEVIDCDVELDVYVRPETSLVVGSQPSPTVRWPSQHTSPIPGSSGMPHYYHPQRDTSPASPISLVMEWDAGQGMAVPHRAPSTEWSALESNLDYWRNKHSRSRARWRQDSGPVSQVRYNDPGSLEEVNSAPSVDYYVTSSSDGLDSEPDSVKVAVRRLWELRTTLEEAEELTDSTSSTVSQVTTFSAVRMLQQMDFNDGTSENTDDVIQTESSTDFSPEAQASSLSRTTSFDSNTEPSLDEGGVCWEDLQLPAYETRFHAKDRTYENVLVLRLGCSDSMRSSLDDTSIASGDSEASAADVAHIEPSITSFENTANITGSSGEANVQGSKLHQLRADSGYKSMENPSFPPRMSLRPTAFEHVSPEEAGKLSPHKNYLSFGDSSESEEFFGSVSHRQPSLGDSSDVDSSAPSTLPRRREVNREYTHGDADVEAERQSELALSATKKRRQYRRAMNPDHSALPRRCHSLRGYPMTNCARDFSVDEKSDALFREFSKFDPWSRDMPRQRLGSKSSFRRLKEQNTALIHYRHGHYPYPDVSPKLASPSTNTHAEDSSRYKSMTPNFRAEQAHCSTAL